MTKSLTILPSVTICHHLALPMMVPLSDAIFLVALDVSQGLPLCSRKGYGGAVSGKETWA